MAYSARTVFSLTHTPDFGPIPMLRFLHTAELAAWQAYARVSDLLDKLGPFLRQERP